MYTELATKLVVTEAEPSVSEAISMHGANAVYAEATCFFFVTTFGLNPKCRITIEQSNDLENWADISGATGSKLIEFDAPGIGTLRIVGIPAAYVRLRYDYTGNPTTGTTILAAGVHTADL